MPGPLGFRAGNGLAKSNPVPAGTEKYFWAVQGQDHRIWWASASNVNAQGDKMSRNRILAVGAVLWTVAIVDGAAHFVAGDLIAPALMAVAAVGGVSLIAI